MQAQNHPLAVFTDLDLAHQFHILFATLLLRKDPESHVVFFPFNQS